MTFHRVVVLAVLCVTAALPSSPNEVQGAETSHIEFPPGDATWVHIRNSSYAHVDKTAYLERMLNGKRVCFFITRPRRFGKSSFIQMVEHFFLGEEKLFRGLKIHDQGNARFFKGRPGASPSKLKKKWLKCPVINLDFREFGGIRNFEEFVAFHRQTIEDIAKNFGIRVHPEDDLSISFLIRKLYAKFQLPVVILIDEYSYPIERALYETEDGNPDTKFATQVRTFYDQLFGDIKSAVAKERIRFVFITGVSRMGISVLESGGNIFQDLTFDKDFATAFGFTEQEIRDNLIKPEVVQKFKLGNGTTTKKEKIELLMSALKDMYDGYNFTIKNGKKGDNVFNPISTIRCLSETNLGNHWCSTGNPDAIVKKLRILRPDFNFAENVQISLNEIKKPRNPITDYVPVEIQMLVYGYLTIFDYNEETEMVTLAFPNHEIKSALHKKFKTFVPRNSDFHEILPEWKFQLAYLMESGNVPDTMRSLQNVFEMKFSPTLFQGVDEQDVTRRIVGFMKLAGLEVLDSVTFRKEGSKNAADGDVDVLTTNLPVNFVMSIKVDVSAFKAIRVLSEYLAENPDEFRAAINDPKKAHFVGVNFKKAEGGKLNQWIYVPYEDGKMKYDNAEASPEYLLENEKFKDIIKKDR